MRHGWKHEFPPFVSAHPATAPGNGLLTSHQYRTIPSLHRSPLATRRSPLRRRSVAARRSQAKAEEAYGKLTNNALVRGVMSGVTQGKGKIGDLMGKGSANKASKKAAAKKAAWAKVGQRGLAG